MRFESMGSRRRLQHCCRLLRLQYVVLIYSFFTRRRLCTWPKTDSSLLTCTDVGGKREGTDTLEVAKQFWKMVSCAISVPVESFRELNPSSFAQVPCGNSGSDDDNNDESSSSSSKVANIKLNAQVKLAAKPSSSSSNSDDSSSNDNNNNNNFVASASSEESAPAPSATQQQEQEDDGVWKPKQTQDVIKSDRSTWVCQHPGWWLDRHPRYITHANHPECQDDLDMYRASLKKRDGFRSHERMHKKNKRSLTSVEKRASSQRVCIVAVDHSLDMTTKAISNNVIDTFGGYKSVALADFDDVSLLPSSPLTLRN